MKALNQDEDNQGLRIAPLIDVVFLLLIFFLVATTFYEAEKDIVIKLAEATSGDERTKAVPILIVNIRESGVIVVNERVLTISQMEQHLLDAKKQDSNVMVVIRCDKRAYHKYFIDVLNLCEKVGVAGIAVATLDAG